MSSDRFFIVPEQYIPARRVTRCYDCPDFENRGGSWGEYDACLNDFYPGSNNDINYRGNDIPDNCPRLK